MIKACLLIITGGFAAQHSRVLPDSDLVQFALVASVALLVSVRTRAVGCVLLGAALFMHAGVGIIAQHLDSRFAGDSLLTQVRIVDFPRSSGVSLVMLVTPIADERLPPLSKVTWFEPPALPALPAIGDTWEFELRLRRPRGGSNPGLFDYEAWLFREAIHATGYVVNGKRNRLLATGSGSYADRRRRRSFVERALTAGEDAAANGVIAAVGVGARHGISRDQWDRYAQSGVSHLMAISGLHVGLAAGTAFALTMAALAITRAAVNHYIVAIMAGVLAAIFYTLLSGLGIPARRATLMLMIAALMLIRRREVEPLTAMAVAGMLIFVGRPVAIMAPGFGLSFAAVALLIWLARRRAHTLPVSPVHRAAGFVRQLVVMQIVLLAGLMPLTVLYFQRIAFLAVPANLLAVPLFSFVTVPATLLALALGNAFSPVGDFALRVASHSITWLEQLISLLLQWPGADITVASITGTTWLVVGMPAAWALLPKGWPGRHCALIAIPFLVLHKPAPPPAGCFDAHVLDVGQGLSIVVQTATTAVIYDTGIAFRGGGSIAEAVLVPFLRSRGIGHVDRLIVSHADTDHSGGVREILALVTVGQTLLGEALPYAIGSAQLCETTQRWQADGVSFRVLYPLPALRREGNNASCVVRIAVGQHSLLLTGDIEASGERELLRHPLAAAADIVVVPHHGSATSSTASLVEQLSPQLAIVSAGYMNRWGLPKRAVVRRWQQIGARVLNTANDGAISLTLCERGGIRQWLADRDRRRRFWRTGAQ